MPKLKIIIGDTVEFKELTDIMSIGSGPKSHIRIGGERVSGQHCEIRREGKCYKVVDLVSRFGTYVNGVPVRECQLRNGDTIVLGDASVTFVEAEQTTSITKKIKKSSVIEELDSDIISTILKLQEPIELGKGRFQDIALPWEDFCLWLGARGIALYLYRGTKTHLISHYGLDEILHSVRLMILDPLMEKLKDINTMREITDLPSLGIQISDSRCSDITKVLALPLMGFKTDVISRFAIEQRSKGLLLILHDNKKKRIMPGEMLLAKALAHQLAAKFHNQELFWRASSDPLTHLYNRGFFEQSFGKELDSAAQCGDFLSIALIDLDYFRYFNEKYGKIRGDEVLREVARLILEGLGPNDVAARYGGEKFVVLLPRQSAIRGYNWAENVRKTIADHPFPESKISVSIGIATFPDNATTTTELLKKADQALYRAKFEGRNKSVYYDDAIDANGLRTDSLAGMISGNAAKDYANIQMLIETVNIMASQADFDLLVEKLLDKVLEITHAERAIVFLADAETKLQVHCSRDNVREHGQLGEHSTSIPEKVFTTGKSLCVVDEIGENQDLPSMSMSQLQLRTVMCTSLHNKEQKTFGVLYVDSQVLQQQYEISDLIFFESLAKQIALALENAKLHKAVLENERLQHELQLASRIQQQFLPQQIPVLDKFAIYGHMWPALEVGGDYYDIVATKMGKVYICIGDVSGKGLGAGLIMVMARTSLHSLIAQDINLDCGSILCHINDMIHENTSADIFMSMLLIELDVVNDIISYSGAGHEHILIYRAKKRCWEKILTGGLVLGVRKDQKYTVRQLRLELQDKLFLYTDGATEAQNPQEQEFKLETLMSTLGEYSFLPCEKLCHSIYQELKNFMGNQKQYDDITLLAIDRM